MTVSDRVRLLLQPVVDGLGLELVDVEHTGATLRVFVDRPGGIDLDGVSAATEAVSAALDGAEPDPVPGRYTLEVSSPGIERALRTPEHFRRALGTPVAVRTCPGVEGDRRVEGVLDAVDDEGVEVAGRRIRYDEIERARTVFEWGPARKPAKKKARTA